MRRHTRNGFTLIEVLVVLAIMGLLAGMVFPAIQRGLRGGKRNAAGSEAESIAGAIEMFYREYGWLPVPKEKQGFHPDDGREQSEQEMTEAEAVEILKVLTATGGEEYLNPKSKNFLDMDRVVEDGKVMDPWGNVYRIKLDLDYDGKVEYRSDPHQYNTRAIVVSGGKPGWTGGSPNSLKDVREAVANVELEASD